MLKLKETKFQLPTPNGFRARGGSRPVYKVCTNLSDFFPEKFFLECFCKVQMIPDFMGSGFALQ